MTLSVISLYSAKMVHLHFCQKNIAHNLRYLSHVYNGCQLCINPLLTMTMLDTCNKTIAIFKYKTINYKQCPRVSHTFKKMNYPMLIYSKILFSIHMLILFYKKAVLILTLTWLLISSFGRMNIDLDNNQKWTNHGLESFPSRIGMLQQSKKKKDSVFSEFPVGYFINWPWYSSH